MPENESTLAIIGGFITILMGWLAYSVRLSTRDWQRAAELLAVKIENLSTKFETLLATDHVRRPEFERRGMELEEMHRIQNTLRTRLDRAENDITEIRRNMSHHDRTMEGG